MATDSAFAKGTFWTKYGSALSSLACRIRSEQPAYILAMTRKAPRLLELCDLAGLDYGNAEILTEKCLQFIDKSTLQRNVLLILDDIIIVGSTIHRLLKEYPALEKAAILCLVCDDTWFTKDLIPGANWQLKLGQHESSVFCNELVQSIGYLNKPYDLDHPILYGELSLEHLVTLCAGSSPDVAYEVSSSFHRDIGKRRFSFLPNAPVVSDLLDSLFHKREVVSPHVCKCRLYYDEETNHATLVPMLIYDATVSDLRDGELSFASAFDQYNQLIHSVCHESRDKDLAHFRLICYLSSYLGGLAFCIRNSNGNLALLSSRLPSSFLNTRDLCFLFGSSAAGQLLQALDAFYPSTLEILRTAKPRPFQLTLQAGIPVTEAARGIRPTFDPMATRLLKRITPYLNKNLLSSSFIHDQVASIFEASFYAIEMPARRRIKKKKSLHGEPHRLAQGFTYSQLSQILADFGALDTGDPYHDTRLSLALDWLVDCGVLVPLYAAANGSFTRLYRYGEDGLCQLKTGFLLASVMRDLFRHIQETAHQHNLPKIALEKINVLLSRRLEKSPQDVAVLKPDIGMTRTIDFRLGYCIHGGIEEAHYQADSGQPISQWLSGWCVNRGILTAKREQQGFTYSNQFFRQHDETLSMVSETIWSKYSMLAKVLWHIDSRVDSSEDNSYLVALSTCHNAESTLKAMQTELFFLFEARADEQEQFDLGDGYSLEWLLDSPLPRVAGYLQKGEAKRAQELLKPCRRRVANADQSANSILSKHRLYQDRLSIVNSIKSHFRETEHVDAYRTYYQSQLLDLLDDIADDANRTEDPGTNDCMRKLVEVGSLCVQVCSLLKLALSATTSVASDHITRAGQLDGRTARKIEREIKESQEALNRLNDSIRKSDTAFPDRAIAELPQISPRFSGSGAVPDSTRWAETLQDTVAEVASLWSALKCIYAENYSCEPWRKELKLLFPEDTLVSPLRWVIWYDIKDSQGRRNPLNTAKTPRLKDKINLDLPKATRSLQDGKFTQDKNDEKFIHTAKPESIPKLLQTLISAADSYGMFLRVGIAGVDDTGQPFLRISGTDFLDSERTFALPKRLGTCIYDEDVVKRLKDYTPEAADVQKETYDAHTLVVSNETYRKAWNRRLPVGNPIKVGYPVDEGKEYTFHILHSVPQGSNLLPQNPT